MINERADEFEVTPKSKTNAKIAFIRKLTSELDDEYSDTEKVKQLIYQT